MLKVPDFQPVSFEQRLTNALMRRVLSGVKSKTPAGAIEVDVSCEADAYVKSDVPEDNFGTENHLIAAEEAVKERSYLKFDLSAYAGVTLLEAVLYQWYRSDCSVGLWGSMECRSVDDDTWTELGINWNNKPAYGAVLDTEPRVWPANFWFTFDVKTFVEGELGADASFCLKVTAVTGTFCGSSKEHAQTTTHPYLYLKYK